MGIDRAARARELNARQAVLEIPGLMYSPGGIDFRQHVPVVVVSEGLQSEIWSLTTSLPVQT